MTETPQRKPGRPRSAQAHDSILETTLRLLAEVGFHALSVEQIAAQAGVGKMTIYRRWPTKEALVSDAIRSIQADMPVIDTGHLRDDLITMYRTALGSLHTIPLIRPLYLRLFSEWSATPDVFQVFLTQLILPRFNQFKDIVEKARERGEIRRDLPLDLVIDLLVGPVLFRWLSTNILIQPSDSETFIEGLTDLVMRCLANETT